MILLHFFFILLFIQSTPASPITVLNAAPHGHVAQVNNAQKEVAAAGRPQSPISGQNALNAAVRSGLVMFSEEQEFIEKPSPSRNGHSDLVGY